MAERVLFSAFPGYGHVNPLLPLAAAYRDAGAEVLFVSGAEMSGHVRKEGFEFRAAGLSRADTEARFLAAHPEFPSLAPYEQVVAVVSGGFIEVAARARLETQIALVESFRPEVVVHDVSEFAAPLAAARSGIPHVAHGVSIPGPTRAIADAISVPAEALCRAAGYDADPTQLLEGAYLDICPPSLSIDGGNPFATVIPLRPLAPPAPEPLGPLLDELPFERTVLVTLGTVVNNAAGLLEAIVAGASELSVNLVVTVGPDRDPAGLGVLPASVRVARYVAYSLLLPRCCAVVSHAGAGTLLASLRCGLPSVLVPVGPEQQLNALSAGRAGAAVVLDHSGITPEKLRDALVRALGDPSYTAGAEAVGDEIAAMPAPGDVLADLPPFSAGA